MILILKDLNKVKNQAKRALPIKMIPNHPQVQAMAKPKQAKRFPKSQTKVLPRFEERSI